MGRYIFRTNNNTPAGALTDVSLLNRVRAALEDTVNAGIDVKYDPFQLEEVCDDRGEKVEVDLLWPPGLNSRVAREHIDRYFVTVE